MTSLALPSLEILGFRCFEHLRIEKLGRVNLIVGKNNIGKSSLLEAIQLYAATDIQRSLWQILRVRDEDIRMPRVQDIDNDALSSIKYLFFGRKDITGPTAPLKIGPVDNPEQQLQSSRDIFTLKFVDEGGRRVWQALSPEEYLTAEISTLRFSVSFGKAFIGSYPLDPAQDSRFLRPGLKDIKMVAIEPNGLDMQKIAQLWDKVTLTDREPAVLKALRITTPGTEAIGTIGTVANFAEGLERGTDRTTIIRVEGILDPIPLRSLGDGMQRVLGIVLALINARDGILLVDEIENGLHYSILEDLWELIFQLAHQLNVQIFATTHSWDCITAFQQAAQTAENEEGVLIRLEYKKDDIVATIFDKRKLAIATRSHIEVR